MAESSQTLFPTLPFPLERVIRGATADEGSIATTFEEGVGETEAWNKAKGVGPSNFPLPIFHLFASKANEDRGSLFMLLRRAYLSLLFLVVISAKHRHSSL